MDEAEKETLDQAGTAEPTGVTGEASENGAARPEAEPHARKDMEELAREYPQTVRDGKLALPEKAEELVKSGMEPLEAMRLCELEQLRSDYGELRQKYDAELENKRNAAASTGSVSGGRAAEKDYYSSEEWDGLSEKTKEKFIKSGKVFDFMKKWSER